jgi:hypothetical protein
MFLLILTFFDSTFAFPLTQHFMILQIQFLARVSGPHPRHRTFFTRSTREMLRPGESFIKIFSFNIAP